jgi:hypothetical protein
MLLLLQLLLLLLLPLLNGEKASRSQQQLHPFLHCRSQLCSNGVLRTTLMHPNIE